MTQISRSLITLSEDALEDLVNTTQENLLRQRMQAKHSREQRQEVRKSKLKSNVSLIATCAPAVDVAEHMGKTWFRDLHQTASGVFTNA